MKGLRRRPTASLFVRLLVFAAATLLAAQAISVVMIFKLPPPLPDFYRLSEVEQALRGARQTFGDRPPLKLARRKGPPGPPMETFTAPAIRARIARNFSTPAADIVIAGDYGPLADRRVFRSLRNRFEEEGGEEQFLIAPFQIGLRQPSGEWLVVETQRHFGLTRWEQAVLAWFGLSTLAMAPIAYLFARYLATPTQLLAAAAERLGRDPQAPPLDVKGSAEITVAATAFNEMQARLRRYVEERTAMVGAVAHDLRTPLTRLRFRIESVNDEQQRAKMAADIEQMEEMISATLTFVRDANRPGARTRLELSSLLESLCDEMAETGADTDIVERGEKVVIEGDPMALRRLFTNLLENAVKFGARAQARVFSEPGFAIVEIADDGPGISPREIERVFEPFYRGEPSRSRKTGGIGLGLAVVRTIARGHGGDVLLLNRRGGGLTARVILPLQPQSGQASLEEMRA